MTATRNVTGSRETSPHKGTDTATKTANLVPLSDVFSFARTLKSRLCIVGAAFSASISGAIVPATAYYFAAASGELGASTDSGAFMESIREQAFAFMILGSLLLISMTMQAALMETAAAEMTMALKQDWFRALLRQDIAYYDMMDVTGEGTIITVNSNKYRKGVGKKLALGVQFFVTFVGSVGFSLYSSWQVTLLVFAIGPLFYVSALFVLKMNTSATARATETYAKAGSIVQASVSNIRTVLSLNAVDIMIEKFKDATKEAYEGAVSQFSLIGLANGSIMGSMIFGYYVVTLFGSYLLYEQVRDIGCDPSGSVEGNDKCDPSGLAVFSALMGMTFGAAVLPQVSSTVEALINAREACYPAFAVIRRVPVDKLEKNTELDAMEASMRRGALALPPYVIDSSSDAGLKPTSINGEIEFKSVSFSYPTRLENKVLSNFSLRLEAGKTVAMVGFSGSGKSTVVQLMERFYDPTSGSITLDGVDLRELNIKWLRNSIALVQQEPKLFECSIRDNIALGRPGAADKDIEMAARMANAHDFIMSFPKGYDTNVGALGDQLSGGQRQRISIARSLVKNPKILLLDESTSALDSESEATVQQALEKLMRTKSMTTFVIAHRLSTIKNADIIAVMDSGVIVETGTHNELLEKKGHYCRLVEAQKPKPTETPVDTPVSSEHRSHHETAFVQSDCGDDAFPTIFEFENVHFEYPGRPDAPVFRGLNLNIRQGETLALVGASGSGKSTTIQLMECFYHPTSGKVKFGGTDVRQLNVRWLRDQLGLVSQQPVLFDCSIEDNIRYGLPGASREEVVMAAKQANAHDFIMSFPEGYATCVGQGSTLISGGQKQRICIARALIKKPKVLLLDEATSAMDSESEKIVQEALDKIMMDPSQTCVLIAHRLSTLAGADRIAVVENGKIHEIGTHDELMALPNGRYRLYQSLQNLDEITMDTSLSDCSNEKLHVGTVGPARQINGISNEIEDGDEADVDKEKDMANAKRARMLAKGDGFYFFIGGIGALFAGVVFPMWGLGFAYMVEVFFTQIAPCPPVPGGDLLECDDYWSSMAHEIKAKSFKVSYGYLAIIICALGGYTMLYWGFGVATERMNRRVRDAAFSSLMRQEVAWYDVRSPGTITSRLSDDAALLHAYTGEPIRTLVAALASVLVGVVLSFVFMWPFALLVLGIIPFMGWAAELEMQMYLGSDESDDDALDNKSPGGVVLEALSNIRTIASLTLEEERVNEYKKQLEQQDPHALRNSITKGATAGVGQFVQMWGMALMFWWGGWLLVNYDIGPSFTYRDFLISMFSLLFSFSGLSIAADGAVDRSKARRAAERIFELIDRQSAIDPLSIDGIKGTGPLSPV